MCLYFGVYGYETMHLTHLDRLATEGRQLNLQEMEEYLGELVEKEGREDSGGLGREGVEAGGGGETEVQRGVETGGIGDQQEGVERIEEDEQEQFEHQTILIGGEVLVVLVGVQTEHHLLVEQVEHSDLQGIHHPRQVVQHHVVLLLLDTLP